MRGSIFRLLVIFLSLCILFFLLCWLISVVDRLLIFAFSSLFLCVKLGLYKRKGKRWCVWGFEKGKGLKGAGGCGKCEGGRPMVVSQGVGVT